MATGSQDGGADNLFFWCSKFWASNLVGAASQLRVSDGAPLLCCSAALPAAGDQKQLEPHVETFQNPDTAAVWR